MAEEKQILGECPICGRELVEGPSVNLHHLKPKSLKGRETVLLHKICHSKIHSLFTERELLHHYHTVERLREHSEMQSFIVWVRRKDPEFYSLNRQSKDKGKKK